MILNKDALYFLSSFLSLVTWNRIAFHYIDSSTINAQFESLHK